MTPTAPKRSYQKTTRSSAKGSKDKAAPARSSASRSTRGKSASKPASKPAAKEKASKASAPAAPSGWAALSLDRKLDIAGVALMLLGIATVLALASANRSSVVGAWIWGLQQVAGWGMYLLPIAWLVFGLWLILRNFERIPWPSLERVVGVLFLAFNSLAWLHWIALAGWVAFPDPADAWSLPAAGQGGGYIGAGITQVLTIAVGVPGAALMLLAWFVLGLALTLDRSVAELFAWLGPLWSGLRDAIRSLFLRLEAQVERLMAPTLNADASGLPEGFSPMPPAATSDGEAVETPVSASASMMASQPVINPAVARVAPVWVLPDIAEMLNPQPEDLDETGLDQARAQLIEETLASFGAPAHVIEIHRGPTITQFGVEPDFIETRSGRIRVRVNKIAALADDLALALAAKRIRIQAPVPGKGYIGIEVPNEHANLVTLRSVLESESFRRYKNPLRFVLGQDVAGSPAASDLSAMPHLLIAGATGSGKSVCVNAIIACMLINNTPDDLRLVMVDPKRVELTGYNGIPHLLAPVVVDLEKVTSVLQWILREMDMRYHKFSAAGVRNLADFNAKQRSMGGSRLPYLVVIIDELADLMMLAPDETERSLTRLAQLARATGIHLILATQRPSVDVVTGLIKANFPARIAFAVASNTDSRVILDQPGAERLLGMGDMLFQAPDAPAPVRLQGAYVSDAEILRIVQHWREQAGQPVESTSQVSNSEAPDSLPRGIPLKQMPIWEDMAANQPPADALMNEAVDLVRRQGRASISMLQRRLRIGYTRAARLIEEMEAKGIVGPPADGTGAREVLDYGGAAPPVDAD